MKIIYSTTILLLAFCSVNTVTAQQAKSQKESVLTNKNVVLRDSSSGETSKLIEENEKIMQLGSAYFKISRYINTPATDETDISSDKVKNEEIKVKPDEK